MLQIYLLKDNRCGHCSQFQSTWEDLQNNIAKKNIQFITIDNMFDIAEKIRNGLTIDEINETDSNVVKKHFDKGVPTLIGKNKKGEFEYKGMDRTFENVSKWIDELNTTDINNANNAVVVIKPKLIKNAKTKTKTKTKFGKKNEKKKGKHLKKSQSQSKSQNGGRKKRNKK